MNLFIYIYFFLVKRCDKKICVFGPPVFPWSSSRWSRHEPKVSKPGKLWRSICCQMIAQPNKVVQYIIWSLRGSHLFSFWPHFPGKVGGPFRFACEISDFYQIDWQEAGTIEFGVPCLVYKTDFKYFQRSFNLSFPIHGFKPGWTATATADGILSENPWIRACSCLAMWQLKNWNEAYSMWATWPAGMPFIWLWRGSIRMLGDLKESWKCGEYSSEELPGFCRSEYRIY